MMKPLFLLILTFSLTLTSLSQKKKLVDNNDVLLEQQIIIEKQILADNLENQLKEIPFAAVRVFVRYKIASRLWQDGKDNTGRAEQFALRAVDDLYENKAEIPDAYINWLKSDLLTLLDLNAKDAANQLREKYKIVRENESDNFAALLKQKDGEKLATDTAIKSLAGKSSVKSDIGFLMIQLYTRKSPEFLRLLTAVVAAEETGQTNFNTNELSLITGLYTQTDLPVEIQKRFFRIVVNKSRNALQTPGGNTDSIFSLLNGLIPEISAKFPELLPEASTIRASLKTKTSLDLKEAAERWDRINSNPDKLGALISEAEQTGDPALKNDLYVRAAKTALQMEKFKYAADLAEKTIEFDKAGTVSETFRKNWRDEFFAEVAEKALKADDPDSANYAAKKATQPLTKAEILKKTAGYYFDHRDPVSAGNFLAEAIKLADKEENTPRKISSLINLIPAAQKIDRTRISQLSESTAASINALPSLDPEDKPQTENCKKYVTSLMIINRDLLPALAGLAKENRNEAIYLSNKINKKEIKIIVDYVLMAEPAVQMTAEPVKEQNKP